MVLYKGPVRGFARFILEDSIYDIGIVPMGVVADSNSYALLRTLLNKNWQMIVIKEDENSETCHIFFEYKERIGGMASRNISIGSSIDMEKGIVFPVKCGPQIKNLLENMRKIEDNLEIEDIKSILHSVSKSFYISELDEWSLESHKKKDRKILQSAVPNRQPSDSISF